MVARGTVGLLAVSLLLGSALAVGPLDDDAGTNRDAADSPEDAQAIVPGSFRGTLTLGIDTADYYAFQAPAGSVLHLQLVAYPIVVVDLQRPDGRPWQSSSGNQMHAFLAEGGTWRMLVKLLPYQVGDPQQRYRIDWSVAEGEPVLPQASGQRWQVLEATWDEGAARGLARVDIPDHPDEPFGALLSLEFHIELPDGPFEARAASIIGGGGHGRGWSVEVEPPDLPFVRAESDPARSYVQYAFDVPRAPGWMRIAAYHTGGGAVRSSLMGITPTATAQAAGDALLVWGDDGTEAATHVATPLAAAATARELDVQAGGPFLGAFKPWTTSGQAVRPDGSSVDVGALEVLLLRGLEPGLWQFRLDPSVGAGPYTAWYALDGFFYPDFGLQPPPIA